MIRIIRNKRVTRGMALLAIATLVQGCAAIQEQMPEIPGISGNSAQKICSSPSATIVVAGFENRTSNYSSSANAGLSVKLSEQLLNTGCFTIADRGRMNEIMEEIGFSNSGLAQPQTVARIGQMTGADLLVFGSITQFTESGPSDRNARVQESVRMEANVTMTGVESGNVLLSETVTGNGVKFGSSSEWVEILLNKSASDKAADNMLEQAVNAIVAGLPASYKGRSVTPVKKKDPNAILAQQVMKEVGTYDGAIDGDIGPRSKEAISQFQEQFDLPVTGELDEATLDKMRSLAS